MGECSCERRDALLAAEHRVVHINVGEFGEPKTSLGIIQATLMFSGIAFWLDTTRLFVISKSSKVGTPSQNRLHKCPNAWGC